MMADSNSLYKFLDIKTYGSTEPLANNSKQYCQVFEKITTSYIYCELSLINKKFEIEDWKIQLNIKCLNEQNELLCDLDCTQNIDQTNHTIFIREGWGTPSPNMFWNIGTYRWEAYIEDQLVATKTFYVESCGRIISETNNPYFDSPQIRLYEGPEDNLGHHERIYMSKFDQSSIRYIWIELLFQTRFNSQKPWPCEIIVNFRKSTGELKGTINSLIFIQPEDNQININSGWGSDTFGTWGIGRYQVDIIFMGTLVTRRYFEVDTKINSPSILSRLKYLFLGKI